MSAPSIAPYLPFRRVRVVSHRVQADPAAAVIELAPDRRYAPRCSRCGARSRRVYSRYRRRVRDLSLGEHRAWLWVPVRRVRCRRCRGIRAEGFEFVDPYGRVTRPPQGNLAAPLPWAVRRALREWCELAEESGIGPLRRFAGTLRRHRRGIVAHARYPIHTGRLEGTNNRIKVIKRRSYGFRDPTYFALKVKQAFPGT